MKTRFSPVGRNTKLYLLTKGQGLKQLANLKIMWLKSCRIFTLLIAIVDDINRVNLELLHTHYPQFQGMLMSTCLYRSRREHMRIFVSRTE